MGKKLSILLIGVVLLAAACSNNGESGSDEASQSSSDAAGDSAATEEAGGEAAGSSAADNTGSGGEQEGSATDTKTSDRMVIYNGTLSLEVDNYDDSRSAIETQVEDMGGYIVESSVEGGDGNERTGSLSARIPQEQFSSFMTAAEEAGTTVLNRSTEGEDVTEDYVDLESRLRSKETQEERLTAFMEEAGNTDALLQISEDLSAVQEEIETLKGEMNYLENHANYATVDITLHERGAASLQSGGDLNTWEKSQQLFTQTLNGIVSAASGIAVFLIGLSPVLVPLLLLSAGVAFFYRKRRKHEE